MDDQTIGRTLRVLRIRAGRSQAEQADLLSQRAGRAVTRNEISRWESERRILTPWWQKHYAATFDVPVEVLRGAVAVTRARRRRERGELGQVRRRQFMGVLAGAVTAVSVPSPEPSSGRLGVRDAERLYRHTARLRRLDDVLGGGDTYATYASQVGVTERLLREATCGAEVRNRLRSLLGEQHQMAGWAAFDAGEHARAREHYQTSLQAAREAGDACLEGNALAFVAYQETVTAQDGTDTARAAYEKARASATPTVAALLLERSAFAHAVVGDARGTDDALNRAREALHRPTDHPEPDWVHWVDEAELDIMSGRCWTELGRPLRAVPVLERGLGGVEDTHARDKALYLTWLASSYAQAREFEQAAATLDVAHGLAEGVASARPVERIEKVARRLAHHRSLPQVGDVLGRIGV